MDGSEGRDWRAATVLVRGKRDGPMVSPSVLVGRLLLISTVRVLVALLAERFLGEQMCRRSATSRKVHPMVSDDSCNSPPDDVPVPSMADLVNTLFVIYRHPSGREYMHTEVAKQVYDLTGRKQVDHSTISRIRSGHLLRPSLETIEALSLFFGVDISYFPPRLAAVRAKRAADPPSQVQVAIQSLTLLRQNLDGWIDSLKKVASPIAREPELRERPHDADDSI